MWFGLVTLFPELFTPINSGVTGRAIKENRVSLYFSNPRDFTSDKHQSVDDHPYGGGPGMVMMPGPLSAAIHTAKENAPTPPKVIYLSPQGKLFDQTAAHNLAKEPALILVSGRYEGIDQRIIERDIDEEWSIGDYILTGGELASLVMMDAIIRLIPGILGDDESAKQDSLTTGLLKYPQYTRPYDYAGTKVPDVLMSGNHKDILYWRKKMALGNTWLKRPDLLLKKSLTEDEKALLGTFIQELNKK